jgi:hypothetical protein
MGANPEKEPAAWRYEWGRAPTLRERIREVVFSRGAYVVSSPLRPTERPRIGALKRDPGGQLDRAVLTGISR